MKIASSSLNTPVSKSRFKAAPVQSGYRSFALAVGLVGFCEIELFSFSVVFSTSYCNCHGGWKYGVDAVFTFTHPQAGQQLSAAANPLKIAFATVWVRCNPLGAFPAPADG